MWNYRFFVIQYTKKTDADVFREEIDYCCTKLKRNVMNESVYNYMRGMFKDKKFNKSGFKYSDFPEVKENLKVFSQKNNCHYAIELLVDIYLEKGEPEKMEKYCDTLMKVDPMRKKYWAFLKNNY